MIIRNYVAGDKPALTELTLRAWQPVFEKMEQAYKPEIYEIFVPDWRAEQMRSLDFVCDSDAIRKFVAEQDGVVVGFSAVNLRPEDFLGEIFMVGVDPAHQGRGIGRELTDASLAFIREAGFALAMVETGGDPGHASARALYEKAGFERVPVARYLMRV